MNTPDPLPAKPIPQHPSQLRVVPRTAAIVGALIIGIIYFFLPQRLRLGPPWLLFAIELVFFLPGLIARATSHRLSHRLARFLMFCALGFIIAALVIAVISLVVTLPDNTNASTLLLSATLLWLFNVFTFALLYWELDGGGPLARHYRKHRAIDFQFPQQADGNTGNWVPHFMDYLYLAFTNATAFSPTDTMPLTRKAKLLMMLEASLAMLMVLILAARAVNILGAGK